MSYTVNPERLGQALLAHKAKNPNLPMSLIADDLYERAEEMKSHGVVPPWYDYHGTAAIRENGHVQNGRPNQDSTTTD